MIENENTTIQLNKSLIRKLKDVKEYPEQTYNSLIERMIDVFEGTKKRDQYDKFIHHIQKQKMKELWDNKEDEAWEHA
ncbi:MAG: hypothetical protein AABX14_02795 [Candidatus Aenigmatarchaeota archaeon]